jgi:MraZ protein
VWVVSEAFRGEFNQKVDGKARVSVPAPFRRVIEAGDPGASDARAKFILVYGGGASRKYLECYTILGMAEVEAKIARMQTGSQERRIAERNFITMSLTAEIDEDGRIVLPPKAREKIALDSEILKDGCDCVFAGALNRFQLWRRDTYEADLAHLAAADTDFLTEGQDMLSLLPDLTGT